MRTATLALGTLFFFGCQTVQAEPPAPRIALAEPELELWIEGSGQVTPQESDEGLRAARLALASALERPGFVAPAESDLVLVARAQGVARTEGRRSAQVAAILGIVVVIAAIVVLIVVSNRSSGGGRAGHVGPVGGRAAPPRGLPPRGGYVTPRYGHGAPGPWFGVGIDIEVPVGPPAPYAPAVIPTLDARLPSRGFFAGDETEIALELRDAATGQVVWSRVGRDDVDPRDAAAVRSLVDRMIGGDPWLGAILGPAGAPPPAAPRPAPPASAPPPPPAVPPPPPPAAPAIG
jgi:hypothetical protein